jgi:hypothetical protein
MRPVSSLEAWMSKRSSLAAAVALGFSLWGCSDEKPGPGVGPDVSWQLLCSPNDTEDACSTSEKPHGPLDGREEDDSTDDYTLKATCSRPGSGLRIQIEDPGRDRNVEKQQEARPRSLLTISRAFPEDNRCTVSVTEYPLGANASERELLDNCEGTENAAGEPGTCVLTGDFDSNGYAFEGSIQCDGLKYKGIGPAGWILRAAGSSGEPVTLQIANCD